VLGDTELTAGSGSLKCMGDGSQQAVNLTVAAISAILTGG